MSEATNKATAIVPEVVNELPQTGAAPKPQGEDFALVNYNAKGTALSISTKAATLVNQIHGRDKDGNPLMGQEDLIRLFGSVVETEKAAFVLRGAAAYEVVVRAEAAGADGTTPDGTHVSQLLSDVAKQVGVDKPTLMEDYRIYKEFGAELVEQLGNAPEALLGREYYRLALQTASSTWTTPKEVVEMFNNQRDAVTYSTSFARRDVKRINDGMSIDEVIAADKKEREATAGAVPSRAGTTVKAKMMNIQVEVSDQMNFIISKVNSSGSNMSNWILRKGKEQFGAAPKPEPAPKKTTTKPKAKGKTVKGKGKTSGKKTTTKPKAQPQLEATEGDTGAA
jgi:hypothetical protein